MFNNIRDMPLHPCLMTLLMKMSLYCFGMCSPTSKLITQSYLFPKSKSSARSKYLTNPLLTSSIFPAPSYPGKIKKLNSFLTLHWRSEFNMPLYHHYQLPYIWDYLCLKVKKLNLVSYTCSFKANLKSLFGNENYL